jgi:hypothetical protein
MHTICTPTKKASRRKPVKPLFYWSGREDLNLRPPEPHSGALARLRYVPPVNARSYHHRLPSVKVQFAMLASAPAFQPDAAGTVAPHAEGCRPGSCSGCPESAWCATKAASGTNVYLRPLGESTITRMVFFTPNMTLLAWLPRLNGFAWRKLFLPMTTT